MPRTRRAPRSFARFDSAPACAIAVARFLDGGDFAGLGMLPAALARAVAPGARLLNLPPPPLRRALYSLGGWTEALPAAGVPQVRGEAVASWLASQPPARSYPAVAVGAASGALVHLCAALGIPFLPQTFLIPVRRPRFDVDDPAANLRFAREAASRLLAANPLLQLHHMHDANNDRLMLRRMSYFRMKWRRLPEAFASVLAECLPPGGTLLVSDCGLRWPATTVDDRHVFQFGGLGGVPPEELRTGSDRVARFLERQGSGRRRWEVPEPDRLSPEAEWGFEPALIDDLRALARERSWRVVRLAFDDPEDLSAPVAELYRGWYRRCGLPADRLLVEGFLLVDPWWALRTASVPFWVKFSVEPSAARLERYLGQAGPFAEVRLAPFPHGLESAGAAGLDRWQAAAAGAGREVELVGIDPDAWPSDLAAFFRFHGELRALPRRLPPAEPLALPEAERFLSGQEGVELQELG